MFQGFHGILELFQQGADLEILEMETSCIDFWQFRRHLMGLLFRQNVESQACYRGEHLPRERCLAKHIHVTWQQDAAVDHLLALVDALLTIV